MDDASENVRPEQPDGAEGMQQADEHMEGVCVCVCPLNRISLFQEYAFRFG